MNQDKTISYFLLTGSIIMLLLSLCGMFGSVLVCLFLKRENQRKSVSIVLQSIAICNTVINVLMIPTTIGIFLFALHIPNGYLVGVIAGNEGSMFRLIWRVPKFCSYIFLLVVAIERMYCVLKPQSVKLVFTRKRGKILVIVTTLVVPATLFPIAISSYFKQYLNAESDHANILVLDAQTVFRLVLFVIFFYIPVIGIVICNGILAILLTKESRRKKRVYHSRYSNDQSFGGNTAISVIILTTVFLICATPYNVCLTFENIYEEISNVVKNTNTGTILVVLETSNYPANIIIFYFGSFRFRSFCQQILCQRRVVPDQNTRSQGLQGNAHAGYSVPTPANAMELESV